MMKHSTTRKIAAVGLAGALALAAATPSFARGGRTAAAAAGGFAAGAVVGSALAGPRYYAPGPGYYAYEPGYAHDSYAYQPEPGYVIQDYPVGNDINSGATVNRSQLGIGCNMSMRLRDFC
jgi:hypothetical protein